MVVHLRPVLHGEDAHVLVVQRQLDVPNENAEVGPLVSRRIPAEHHEYGPFRGLDVGS